MQDLINKIKSTISLTTEAEEHLLSISKEKTVEKGESVIRQGQTVEKTFFVTDGCLRSYCTDKEGREHTLQFAIKGWWISDFMAIFNSELASVTVECITDSKVIEFNTKKIEATYLKFPEFEHFQRKNLERHLVSLHKRILNQLQLSASERYDLFIEQFHDLEQYIPNYHIASYLGITQQSLSRIRAKKHEK